MPRSQRLTFLAIAVVIAIVGVAILTATQGDDEEQAGPARATATATTRASETPERQPPLVTGNGIAKLRFRQGDTVRFRVRADVSDEVHVHGYDLMRDIEPGQTVTFSFPATITGIFEIELEDAGKQIAELRVDPS